MLGFLHGAIVGLEIYPERMKANLHLSGGLISAETVMMTLGRIIGRQEAHAVVHHAAHAVAGGSGATFLEVLSADPRVSAHLSPGEIANLLDPASYTGLSARIARDTSTRAHAAATKYRPTGT